MSNTKLYLSIILMIIPLIGIGQSISECRKIVEVTVEALNTKSSEMIEQHLATDFTIAGQEGPVAIMVLKQIIAQLADPIISYEEVSHLENENSLVLVYDFEYKEKGSQETQITFDKNNKIKSLDLFKMTVKKMGKDDTKILKSEADKIEVPMEMMGRLISVDVAVNGVKRKFLLDTGAPKVILNANYFKPPEDLSGVRKISSSKSVNGSITGLDLMHIESIDLHGIRIEDQEVLTVDLSNLERHTEEEIYGLIGYEMIKDYDLIFNYDEMKLTLVNPDFFECYESMMLAEKEIVVVPFEIEAHIPVLNAKVNSITYSFGLDSGAETNLIDDDLFEKFNDQINNITIDTLSGMGDISREVNSAKINSTHIGNKELKNMDTVFSDISHINEGYKTKIDGLLGYELLSRQVSVISYARKELRLY